MNQLVIQQYLNPIHTGGGGGGTAPAKKPGMKRVKTPKRRHSFG